MPGRELFRIHFPDEDVEDLQRRLRSTRWPRASERGWDHGIDPTYLRALCDYWGDGFDWREQERRLNEHPQFVCGVGDVDVHLVRARAVGGAGIPILLGHGWPGSFAEYLPVVPLLVDPTAHGIDGPAFDVVIPSLPGYGFSSRPLDRSWDYTATAELWHELMELLGYSRFAVGGTDFGAGVGTMMALQHPERVIGLHLSTLELDPVVLGGEPLSADERAYLERRDSWWADEGGYKAIQSTKPGTLAVALADSPAGLAAWIAEKWIGWGDPGTAFEHRVDRDALLTVLTLYWLTGTIATSMLDYRDNRDRPARLNGRAVTVPTGIALFADPAGEPPIEWIRRLYTDVGVRRMPRGGHFAATEAPELLAADIVGFIRDRC